MDELYDKKFIQRYLSGKCTNEEKTAFLTFLQDARSDRGDSQLKLHWELAENDRQIFLGSKEKIYNQIISSLQKTSSPLTNTSPQSFISVVSEWWNTNYSLRYAAIISFFMVASLVFNTILPAPSIEPEEVKIIERITHNGQHLTFMLDDGTKIHLNSNSALRFPEKFSDTSRTVFLNGEGFFEVARDARRPFTVVTDAIRTTALGTSFNIHYDIGQTDISLVTGMVKIEIEDPANNPMEFTLSPGQELHCDLDAEKYIIDEFSKESVTGWKDGILVFNNASLEQVKSTLEEWYDVSVQIDNRRNRNLSSWSYSGKFENQTLENVLRGMGYVEKFAYEMNGKQIKLMFN